MASSTNLIRLLCLLLLAAFSYTSSAAERGTSRQAKRLLENAVDVLQMRGAEQAFSLFNDQRGGFVQGDLYIFAIDMKGTYFASGANPKLVGQNLTTTSDAAGKPIGAEILKLADRIGYGIVEYEWLNRETNDVEHKFSRIRRVDDYVLGVGFYLPESAN